MKFLFGLILIAAVFVIGAGMTGFVPGLSSILGADKPKDLGITYSADMPKTIQNKTGPEISSASLPDSGSPQGSLVFTGSKPIAYSISSAELTALMNFHFWKYYPLTRVQVKINPDGMVESSGIINMQQVLSAIESYGFKTDDVRNAMSDYHIPVLTMPFYVKFKGGVDNGNITLAIESAEAGKVPIPNSVISTNTGRVISALETLAAKPAGFTVKKLSFDGGKMTFDGTVPEKESAVGQ
jgi:hypothetical protein